LESQLITRLSSSSPVAAMTTSTLRRSAAARLAYSARVGRHHVNARQHGFEAFGGRRDLLEQGDVVMTVHEV